METYKYCNSIKTSIPSHSIYCKSMQKKEKRNTYYGTISKYSRAKTLTNINDNHTEIIKNHDLEILKQKTINSSKNNKIISNTVFVSFYLL